MQRISRAPRCSDPCPVLCNPSRYADDRLRITNHLSRHGFTLIEVVIALALCGLVAAVTAASLNAALGAERQAVQLRETRRAADIVHQALLNPSQRETLLSGMLVEWNLSESAESTGQDTNSVRWTVWTLSHRGQPARQAKVIVRD